jgi:hypothetical protein
MAINGISKEQIERAKAAPVLDYLLRHEGDNFDAAFKFLMHES